MIYNEFQGLKSVSYTHLDVYKRQPVMLKYDMANSGGFPYDKTTDTPSKKIGSIVIPCDLESNVIQLHKQLFGTEDYQPSEKVQSYNDTIIDVTGKTTKDSETDQFSDQDDFFGNGIQQNTNDSGDGGADDSAGDSQ